MSSASSVSAAVSVSGGVQCLSCILPSSGLVYSDKLSPPECFARSRLIPLRSVTLQKILELEQKIKAAQAAAAAPSQ